MSSCIVFVVLGLIVNVADPSYDRLEDRSQTPCFYVSEPSRILLGRVNHVPVYEVWFWHREVQRWFVMSTASDPHMEAQGVVYFRPNDVQALRDKVRRMRVR